MEQIHQGSPSVIAHSADQLWEIRSKYIWDGN